MQTYHSLINKSITGTVNMFRFAFSSPAHVPERIPGYLHSFLQLYCDFLFHTENSISFLYDFTQRRSILVHLHSMQSDTRKQLMPKNCSKEIDQKNEKSFQGTWKCLQVALSAIHMRKGMSHRLGQVRMSVENSRIDTILRTSWKTDPKEVSEHAARLRRQGF